MSSSGIQNMRCFKYDVFLSFRGEDTRKTFVDHLYHALHNRGIITYKDDEKIEKGERIDDQLIRSIEDSRFYIIVFSKSYASSSWCLDELVKIMECQKMVEHTAYPVFYDVEPTEVRNQSGAVGEAFAKHQKGSWIFHLFERFKRKRKRRVLEDPENEDDVIRWRKALQKAAGLAGMELKTTVDGHEFMFIQKLVEEISLKLHFINSSDDENLIGMETRVGNVVSSLDIGHDDVRMIGIKGMGGSGKATLARAVFDHLSILFEGKSFVENVAQVSKGSLSGLKELQKQVLSDALNDPKIYVRSVSEGKIMMKRMIRTRKVLIVLDDVDDVAQLEALAGHHNWFKPGSRIIITARDEQVLARRVNLIHHVSLLSYEEAICLFSRYAFQRELPIQGYEELSGEVVNYANGLPLTIKVLGSFLYGRPKHEWVDALERLKNIPLTETLEKMKISYDGLEDDLQQIFLDVACILKGEIKDEAIRTLESCGFNAKIGLRVLEQKSLITVSDDGRLLLHDHIEEMGKHIVRRMHPDEPQNHNRLWIKEEIEYILHYDLGTGAIRCIKLKGSDLHPAIIMKGLRKMNGLRFLYVDTPFGEVDEVGQYLPNTLQSLHWPGYPLECLPNTFRANKLADLAMVRSNICQLREGGARQVLNNLKFLDLKYSNLRTFDLGVTTDLEMLDLKKCKDSLTLHMPVTLLKLKFLNLSGSKVSNLNLGLVPNLEKLTLSIKEIKHLPDSICMMEHMKYLNLKSCSVLQDIRNICMLKHLKCLKLKSCLRLEQLPQDLDRLEFLEELYLIDCISLRDIPNKICNMEFLRFLHLPYCILVENFPKNLGCLKSLEELNIEGAGIRQLPQSLFQMKGLRIVWSRGRLESCGFTSLTEISRYTASCYV